MHSQQAIEINAIVTKTSPDDEATKFWETATLSN